MNINSVFTGNDGGNNTGNSSGNKYWLYIEEVTTTITSSWGQ